MKANDVFCCYNVDDGQNASLWPLFLVKFQQFTAQSRLSTASVF